VDDRRRALSRAALPVALLLAAGLAAGLALTPASTLAAPPPPPARPSPAPPAAAPEAPTLEAIRQALDAWELTRAADLVARMKPTRAEAGQLAVLHAALDLARADHQAVVKRLTPIVRARPDAYEARILLGRALLAIGRDTDGVAVLDAMADDYNDDRITTSQDLAFLGTALHLTGYVKNANRVFQEAIDKNPDDLAARLGWADLFLSKYNYRDADQLYREVLAKRPGDLRARLGTARVAIASDSAFSEAAETLERIVAEAPECVPAHTLLALIDLSNERPEAALERLAETSLALAPNDPEALALVAAARYLLDDAKGFAAAERRALSVNPKHAALYVTVAQHAERVHRYVEAQRLLDKALALDPESGDALSALGVAWSRLGDDAKATRTLEQAFEADPYNVITFNLLKHFYDDVDKTFMWLDAPPMRVRVDKREAAVLERYVPRLLDEAWRHFAKKYAFKPKPPVHVEIFPSPETFAVRSVGLPGLAAHGICFGHVVTARSPSAGDFNWAEVLWHELAHVYHLQLSGSRVPRWFTEGFAVYESIEGRKSWQREMDPELWRARKAGKLRGFGDFNLAFTQAKSLDDILVAYYHATQVARFLDETWGFPKIKRMLELWGDKLPTPEVIQRALGVDLAELDRRFFAWLDKELSYLAAAYPVDLQAVRADAAASIAAVEAPSEKNVAPSGAALARAAAAKLTQGDAAGAEALAERALAVSPDEPLALFVRGALRLAGPNKSAGRADYERLVALGQAGVDVRRELAEAAAGAGDLTTAAKHLEAALALDPKQIDLHRAIIKVLDQSGKKGDAFAWRAKLAELDQMDPTLALELLAGAREAKAEAADVLRWGELAVHIAPFEPSVHLAFARAALAVGAKDIARYEAESALVIDPKNAEAKAIVAAP